MDGNTPSSLKPSLLRYCPARHPSSSSSACVYCEACVCGLKLVCTVLCYRVSRQEVAGRLQQPGSCNSLEAATTLGRMMCGF